jgi:beta-RFAP synthase
MIESPGIELLVEPAQKPVVHGPLSERAARILGIIGGRLAASGAQLPSFHVRIASAPPEHVGLGVGTQLSLAIAAAVLRLIGETSPGAKMLAHLTQRGRRSGVGLHGFLLGGLIVDGGRRDEICIPPLLTRLEFPDEWSIIVVRPPGNHGLHGTDEVQAFAGLKPPSERLADRLCRIVLLQIMPAVVERDLSAFGDSLEELQSAVGASFAPAQGGDFNSPMAAEITRELHRAGFVGCGQSSWGPTLYAFSDRPREEVGKLADDLRRHLSLEPSAVITTSAANRGAVIQEL